MMVSGCSDREKPLSCSRLAISDDSLKFSLQPKVWMEKVLLIVAAKILQILQL